MAVALLQRLLAVLAVHNPDLPANFILQLSQQQRVGMGHDGTLLEPCEEEVTTFNHV